MEEKMQNGRRKKPKMLARRLQALMAARMMGLIKTDEEMYAVDREVWEYVNPKPRPGPPHEDGEERAR